MATAKAVAAGNSCRQEDVIATANLSRKAVSDMLTACKVKALELFRMEREGDVVPEYLVWCGGRERPATWRREQLGTLTL